MGRGRGGSDSRNERHRCDRGRHCGLSGDSQRRARGRCLARRRRRRADERAANPLAIATVSSNSR